MNDPLVYILILNWNGKEDTLSCLNSLQKVVYSFFEVVVVDNGSSDCSEEAIISRFPQYTFLQNGKNLGYAEGNNRAILYALAKGADAILLLNNDTIVSPDFLSQLVKAKKDFPKGGVFGSKSLNFFDPDTIDHTGGIWENTKAEFFCLDKGKKDYERAPFLVDYVSGCSLLIEKRVFEKVGLLDERFFLLWEESDFCMRAKKTGIQIVSVPYSKVWHKISASFSGKPLLHYYWWRNRLLFLEKNFTKKERKALYKTCILKEIRREFRHFFCKALEAFFLGLFSPKKLTPKKREKLQRYKAGCKGIFHYFRKKFYGPIYV